MSGGFDTCLSNKNNRLLNSWVVIAFVCDKIINSFQLFGLNALDGLQKYYGKKELLEIIKETSQELKINLTKTSQ